MTERPDRLAFDEDEASALAELGLQNGRRQRQPGCPDPALVLALDEGVLDAPAAARVRAHVDSCQPCQRAAADLARMLEEPASDESLRRVDDLVAAGIRKTAPRRRLEAWLLPAGGLALAAGIALIVVTTRPSPPATLEAPVAEGPRPTAFIVDRPALPQPDVDLTVRGVEAKPSLDNEIASALDLADTGDVTASIARLEALVSAHARSQRAALALGAVQLRAGRNAEALEVLERARALDTDAEIRDELQWFLSVALVRTGTPDRARSLLDGLCSGSGARASRACAGLAEIARSGK